jgi:hypothetical protein
MNLDLLLVLGLLVTCVGLFIVDRPAAMGANFETHSRAGA